MYVGVGPSDIQRRPSQWANLSYFICDGPEESLILYREYLDCRADLVQFLDPLRGAELICDCALGCFCHTCIIVQYVEHFHGVDLDQDTDVQKLDAMCEACVMEGLEEDAKEDPDIAPAPKFNPDIGSLNETVRSGAARLHQERPSWLPSWLRLIVIIRSAAAPVFWERFSGRAGLTR